MTPPNVLLPEPTPLKGVGSRAAVVFGRDTHIALARVRSRAGRSRGSREPVRRRLPVSEREIPSLTEGETATASEEQRHPVAMPSLWDLLVAPTSASSATTPLFFTSSSDQQRVAHQSPLWE